MSLTVLNVGQNYHVRGGSDRYLFALESLLQRYGHEVIPFATDQPANLATPWSAYFPPSVNFARPGPIDVIRYLYSRPAARAVGRLVARRRPDLAHLHIYYGQLTGSILRPLRAAGIPILQTLHEFKTVCPTYGLFAHGRLCESCQGRQFWRAMTHRCNRGSLVRSALSSAEAYVSRWLGAVDGVDHFIAVSDFLRDKVIELGLPAHKVTTVHNFVDCSGIDPVASPGRYLLFFGRLERIKGVHTLLDAVAPLSGIEVLLAGEGGERQALQAQIHRRGLAHVKLLGFKTGTELQELIRGSICTVAPSECYETFGLTLVESFAHGRPVVASRIGGMTEVVDDGETGFTVPPGDAEALRERLLWMVNNRDSALEMGRAARRAVERRFSPESHYEKIMAIYRGVGAA